MRDHDPAAPAPSVFDALAAIDPPPAPVGGAPVGPELAIVVEYRVRGQVLRGAFEYRVPTVVERRQIEVLSATLLRGAPRECFSPEALAAVARDAYLAVTVRRWPAWCPDPDAFEDPRLLNQIYGEALRHEARFLGGFGDSPASTRPTGDPQPRGRRPGVVGDEVGAAESR